MSPDTPVSPALPRASSIEVYIVREASPLNKRSFLP